MPTLTIATPPFVVLSQAALKAGSRSEAPLVVLPYTIMSMSDQDSRDLADKYIDEIISKLLGKG